MERWVDKKIKELCIIGRGRVINQDEISNHPGTYPVYSSQSFNNGEMGKIDSYDFDGEYVTWTTDGAYAGTIFFREGKFNCTNVCGTLRAKKNEELDLLFLSYLLATESKKYVSYIGNPKLMNGVVAEISLKMPKQKSEQTQIASILTKADQAISQTEKLIAKYQRIKTGLMQDLLTKGIDAKGNIRNKATHKFVIKNGIEVPEEWEVEELNNYISYISYGFTNPMPEAPEGPYLITAANINEGRILYESCRRTTEKAFKELLTNKSRPKLNDILITKDGSLGRVAIVDRGNLCINQSVAVMRTIDEKVIDTFFKMLLESSKYQATILGDAGGSTIKHIYITKIAKMLLAIPNTLGEQRQILDAIEMQENLIVETQKQLSKFNSLKTGLMQDLLSGKVRVKVKEKEMANG